jgi:hypothetical protein
MLAVALAIVVPMALLREFKGIGFGSRSDAVVQLVVFLILMYPWTAVLLNGCTTATGRGFWRRSIWFPRFSRMSATCSD